MSTATDEAAADLFFHCELLRVCVEKESTARRLAVSALREARNAGVTRQQMVELTGWSRSRIDQLLRNAE